MEMIAPSARRVNRRRQSERGAALFIVMMVIVLVSAIGAFAVRSSSLVEVASGYSRRWSQAAYVGEFATRSVSSDMAGKEDAYFQEISSGTNVCRASEDLGTYLPAGSRVPCFAVESSEVFTRLQGYSGVDISQFAEGLFGNVARPGQEGTNEAAFRVEITDLGPAPNLKAGTDLKGEFFKHKQVTFTATGQVRPKSDGTCKAEILQSSGVQSVRAHVTFMSTQ
jgi:hypothetical protein